MPTRPRSFPRTRPSAAKRNYDGKWQRESAEFLRQHPTCEILRPGAEGMVPCGRPSVVVHHDPPHRGDLNLFWDRSTWFAGCKECHDGPVQSEERTGRPRGCDASGIPLDPGHRWNRKANDASS